MILTTKQEQGLKTVLKKYNNGEKYCVISGYAGVGKSTLVKFIVQNLPYIDPEEEPYLNVRNEVYQRGPY